MLEITVNNPPARFVANEVVSTELMLSCSRIFVESKFKSKVVLIQTVADVMTSGAAATAADSCENIKPPSVAKNKIKKIIKPMITAPAPSPLFLPRASNQETTGSIAIETSHAIKSIIKKLPVILTNCKPN